MRIIDGRLLEEAANCFGLNHLDIVEKDFRMTEVLHVVLSANQATGFRPVFAGGTAIARAHRMTARMSEDVDIKLVPADPSMSKSAQRRQLSEIKGVILAALRDRGFDVGDPVARNANANINYHIAYPGMSLTEPLRPHILLETTLSSPRLPTTFLPLSSFVAEAHRLPPEIARIECISATEAAAEKLVALTRRTAGHLEGTKPDAYDPFLVRHVYDLHGIFPHVSANEVVGLARSIALDDAEQFQGWFPGYHRDPSAGTRQALNWLETSDQPRQSYAHFMQRMVYGPHVPYEAALQSVRALGVGLADSLQQQDERGDLAAAALSYAQTVSWVRPGTSKGAVRFGWDGIPREEADRRTDLMAQPRHLAQCKAALLEAFEKTDPAGFAAWDAGGRMPRQDHQPQPPRRAGRDWEPG